MPSVTDETIESPFLTPATKMPRMGPTRARRLSRSSLRSTSCSRARAPRRSPSLVEDDQSGAPGAAAELRDQRRPAPRLPERLVGLQPAPGAHGLCVLRVGHAVLLVDVSTRRRSSKGHLDSPRGQKCRHGPPVCVARLDLRAAAYADGDRPLAPRAGGPAPAARSLRTVARRWRTSSAVCVRALRR